MAAVDKSLYEKFTIESVDQSKTADISAGVVNFRYYEDVYSPMLTATVVVANTGNVIEGDDGKIQSLYNGFPLRGGERLQIKIAGNSDDNEGLELNDLYVGSITNVMIESGREIFTLNLVSREAITNETVRVGKKFPVAQKISDSVKDICENYLSTDKLYDIDETMNPYGFYGNMRKPFTILTMLASKSVPGNVSGKDATAGYFFFETQQGFRFKSIDSLIRTEPFAEKYVYSPGVVDSNDATKDFKILEFSTSKNQNLLENLERGAFCSHRKYLNPLTFEYTPRSQTVFKLEDYSGNIENLGADIDVVLPSLSSRDSRTLASVPSRYVTGILDIGITDKSVSELGNADPARIHSQAMMRYNTLFTQILTMTIPLNTNLKAGDILECEFPRIDQEKRKEPDPEQSGLYLIKKLTHYFDATGSYTKLQLARDTTGRKAK
jgi:hypothetical protein|tara:strand:- start:592 stop:1905 length:1314 start_codon:yes stop_codon:yes gene_type:complete